MSHLLQSSRAALLALALVVLGLVVTLDRAPILWNDDALYASIARSVQQFGDGRPSTLRRLPDTTDHAAFYGPVSFRLAAWSFEWFGFSLRSFRAVSLLGGLLIAGAAFGLASALGLPVARRTWSAAIVLLEPSIGASATNGRMDALAVGLSLTGIALLVTAVARPERRTMLLGATAGAFLLLGALTTPRVLPLVGVSLLGMAVLLAATHIDRALGLVTLAAAAALGAGIGAWGILAHGTPLGWVQALATTVPHAHREVTLLGVTARDWQLAGREWTLVSLIVAVPLTLAGAWHLRASRSDVPSPLRHATLLAICVAGLHLLVALAVTNQTFGLTTYFAAPLLAVALALPPECLSLRRATGARLLCAVVLVFAAGRIVKYATVAATWRARDPQPIADVVAAHVPAGAQVIGPARFYLFAVEGAGAEMVSLSGTTVATWPRHERPDAAVLIQPRPGARRFLLTPTEGEAPALPEDSTCPSARLVAEYHPPADTIPWLGWVTRALSDPGYPRSALFELPDACVHEPGRIIDRTD